MSSAVVDRIDERRRMMADAFNRGQMSPPSPSQKATYRHFARRIALGRFASYPSSERP